MIFLSINKNISFENSSAIFTKIADGELTTNEIKEILLNINQIGINENLLLGAIDVFLQRSKKIKISGDIFDVCGTGGDDLNTLNISTAVAFILASFGVKVAKHGNKAVSSNSGSADIFSELGINISADPKEIINSINRYNLAFIFAPFFHQSFKYVSKARAEIGVRTIFNYIGPLLNPANPTHQLIGCSNEKITRLIANISLKLKKKRIAIIHSFDGMDEISISDKTLILDVKNGEISENIICPTNFNLEITDISQIAGKDPKYNSERMVEIFSGKQNAYFDIVSLNSAYALFLRDDFNNIYDAFKKVKSNLSKKLPLEILIKMQNDS